MLPPKNSSTKKCSAPNTSETELCVNCCDCAEPCSARRGQEWGHSSLVLHCMAQVMHEYGLERDTWSIHSRCKSTVNRSTQRWSVVLFWCALSFQTVQNRFVHWKFHRLIYRRGCECLCECVRARRKTRFGGLLHN